MLYPPLSLMAHTLGLYIHLYKCVVRNSRCQKLRLHGVIFHETLSDAWRIKAVKHRDILEQYQVVLACSYFATYHVYLSLEKCYISMKPKG